MTQQDIVKALASKTRLDQAVVLTRFAHSITIIARDTYAAGTEEVHSPRRLRALNEIQHRLLGHIEKLLADDPQRYPDDVLIKIVTDNHDSKLFSLFQKAMK